MRTFVVFGALVCVFGIFMAWCELPDPWDSTSSSSRECKRRDRTSVWLQPGGARSWLKGDGCYAWVGDPYFFFPPTLRCQDSLNPIFFNRCASSWLSERSRRRARMSERFNRTLPQAKLMAVVDENVRHIPSRALVASLGEPIALAVTTNPSYLAQLAEERRTGDLQSTHNKKKTPSSPTTHSKL